MKIANLRFDFSDLFNLTKPSMCDANKMTDAVKTAINDATDLAEAQGNASLEPIHVIFTLFSQEGLAQRVCEKVLTLLGVHN